MHQLHVPWHLIHCISNHKLGHLTRAIWSPSNSSINLSLYPHSPYIHSGSIYAIGLVESATPGVYEWLDNTQLNYTNWAPATALTGDPPVGVAWFGSEGGYRWDDTDSGTYISLYVCEIYITGELFHSGHSPTLHGQLVMKPPSKVLQLS